MSSSSRAREDLRAGDSGPGEPGGFGSAASRPAPNPGPEPEEPTLEGQITALLLVLPLVPLALPASWSTSYADPLPAQSGAGLAALAALPLGIWTVARGARPNGWALGLLALFSAWAWALRGAERTTDTLAADQSLLLLAVAGVQCLGASLLDRRGRGLFAALVALLSVAWTLPALLGDSLGGPLGNTGSLSQASLAGAAIAAAWLLEAGRGHWPATLLALAAVAGFLIHAWLAPVLAGAAALAILASLCLAARWGASSALGRGLCATGGLLSLALLALLVGGGSPTARAAPEGSGAELEAAMASSTGDANANAAAGSTGGANASGDAGSNASASSTSGLEVRRRIWSRVPALVADSPWLGAGPGQFEAAFPPHRDPLEIERSTQGRRADHHAVVNHAHHDLLEGLAQGGLLGGTVWILLWGTAALAGWRALKSAEADRARLGAGLLALCLAGTVHAPLLHNPAASALAFALLGATCRGPRRPILGRAAAVAATLSLLCLYGDARELARLGLLLGERQELSAAYIRDVEKNPDLDAIEVQRATVTYWVEERQTLEEALATRPDSTLALSLLAQNYQRAKESPEHRARALEHWRAVLRRRPHDLVALLNAGLLETATDGRRKAWEAVLRLDPAHPIALANLARLELEAGDPQRGLAHAARLEADGRLDEPSRRSLALAALRQGWIEASLELFAPLEPELAEAYPETFYARALAAREAGAEEAALAWECLTHRLWAREHLEEGDAPAGVRSLRQALRLSSTGRDAADPSVRGELAAALVLAGREAEALELWASVEERDPVLRSLPGWAREALEGLEGALLARARREPEEPASATD